MILKSHMIGGFECADHINRSGDRVDMLSETAHSKRVSEDYRLLSELGILTVREGICWSQVERRPFDYDFSEVLVRIKAAKAQCIQQIWDICHFGYPDDLMPAHPRFAQRFSSVCAAFTSFYITHVSEPPIIIPINEISFLSWHSGEMRGTVPFATRSGFDIKYHLCKAAIQGIEAIRKVEPRTLIMLVEPLVKIHPYEGCDMAEVERMNEEQFQALDIIAGRLCPELGGRPEYLELLGFNYYYNNQWVHQGSTLCWLSDPRTEKLSGLLLMAWQRYQRPIILSETGHFGEHRGEWIEHVGNEYQKALAAGVDLRGICIYPVIDRPDWDDLSLYCHCGIWDMDGQKNRIPHQPYIDGIMQCERKIDQIITRSGGQLASTSS